MTRREVDRLLAEWQAALRLRDWQVTVQIVPASEFADEDEADVDPHKERRSAVVRISEKSPDPELALVHELLHLWTRSLAGEDFIELIEEHAIEAISVALVTYKRQAARAA